MTRTAIAMEDLDAVRIALGGMAPEAVLTWVADAVPGAAFASSLGQEDQVITNMIARLELPIPIFTLDTGRLFPETYELLERTRKRYSMEIAVYFPDAAEVERMVSEKGINLFRDSVDNRKRCCGVRKLAPLARALAGRPGWICGLRREQSDSRSDLTVVDWDAAHKIPKFNPLIGWSRTEVEEYIARHDVPCSPLHAQGFISIGCACCTRPVAEGEPARAGRWWWEDASGHKECGLHWVDGKPERSAGRENVP